MIKFGFETYETEFEDWSKHHKTIGVHVKRVYEDGEVVLANTEELRKIVEENEDKLETKHVNLVVRGTGERRQATDYYLPVSNLQYQEANIPYYSVGSMNTEQETKIRLKFLLEYHTFYLDYSYKSSGSFATSFADTIANMDAVEDLLEEVVDKDLGIAKAGIERDQEGDYRVVAVSEIGEVIDFEIEKNELIQGLIGVEIYEFKHKIL